MPAAVLVTREVLQDLLFRSGPVISSAFLLGVWAAEAYPDMANLHTVAPWVCAAILAAGMKGHRKPVPAAPEK